MKMILVLLAATSLVSMTGCNPTPQVAPSTSIDRTLNKSEVQCIRGGCSGQLCTAAPGEQIITTCEWKPEYACYKMMECKANAEGVCGFVESTESKECFKNPPKE